MQIVLLQNVVLPDLGRLDIGPADVPDGMAAALIYQGLAAKPQSATLAPMQVAATLPPRRGRKPKQTQHEVA